MRFLLPWFFFFFLEFGMWGYLLLGDFCCTSDQFYCKVASNSCKASTTDQYFQLPTSKNRKNPVIWTLEMQNISFFLNYNIPIHYLISTVTTLSNASPGFQPNEVQMWIEIKFLANLKNYNVGGILFLFGLLPTLHSYMI